MNAIKHFSLREIIHSRVFWYNLLIRNDIRSINLRKTAIFWLFLIFVIICKNIIFNFAYSDMFNIIFVDVFEIDLINLLKFLLNFSVKFSWCSVVVDSLIMNGSIVIVYLYGNLFLMEEIFLLGFDFSLSGLFFANTTIFFIAFQNHKGGFIVDIFKFRSLFLKLFMVKNKLIY